MHSDIETVVEADFSKILSEEDEYMTKGSGFTLSCIDGVLLRVYKYTPLGGCSYIPLPDNIEKKKSTINPQNIDEECFKWEILAKHVKNNTRKRVGSNYYDEEHRYDFSRITTPTPISDIRLFEHCNPITSVNVYGLFNNINNNNNRSSKHIVHPIKVCDTEKEDHFDLLFLNNVDTGKSHYCYISNFTRLISNQKNRHGHRLFICKKCFTSFNNQPLKYRLYGKAALTAHKKICKAHRAIVPVMPQEGDILTLGLK
jgi:hypothetical protein